MSELTNSEGGTNEMAEPSVGAPILPGTGADASTFGAGGGAAATDRADHTGPVTATDPAGASPDPGASWWQQRPAPGAPGTEEVPSTDPATAPGGYGPAGPGGGWYGPSGPGGMPPATAGPSHGGWNPTHRTRLVMGATGFAALMLAGVGIGAAVWGGAAPATASALAPTGRSTTPSAGSSGASAAGAPSDISTIAAKVDPGLVDVNTVLGYQTGSAAGTGIVLTSTGEILTNNHVIEGATSIKVTDIGNGKTYTATVVGYDATYDVAVIQLQDASGLTTATLGNSSNVAVGEAVVGIGNAGGTGGTPSTAGGSVTALNQAITASDSGSGTTEHLTGLIESNADIQPGDSGGPLVNTSGQVVAMDTAASSSQGFTFNTSTGQAFSIPINTAVSVAKKIEAGDSSSSIHLGQTAFLGVEVESASSSTGSGSAGGFGLGTGSLTPTTSANGAASSGADVAGVASGTPAQSAGLTAGDVITSLGGTTVTSPTTLSKAIEQYHPGNTVKVVWTNTAGQTQSATITLTTGPAG